MSTTEHNSQASEQDLVHLRRAIELSKLATTDKNGNTASFGAVLVIGNGIVHEGWYHAFTNNDPIHHARKVGFLLAFF